MYDSIYIANSTTGHKNNGIVKLFSLLFVFFACVTCFHSYFVVLANMLLQVDIEDTKKNDDALQQKLTK
jgi:hypothetical protein